MLSPGVLVNETVVEGDQVTLNCKVESLEDWRVRWGRTLDKEELGFEDNMRGSLITIGDETFWVSAITCVLQCCLKTITLQHVHPSDLVSMSDKFVLSDLSYLHSLQFRSVSISDMAKYVCVLFNKGIYPRRLLAMIFSLSKILPSVTSRHISQLSPSIN